MDFHETYILLSQDYYVRINKMEQEYYTYWLLYTYITGKKRITTAVCQGCNVIGMASGHVKGVTNYSVQCNPLYFKIYGRTN